MKNNNSNMTGIAVNKSLLKEYQTSYGRTVYLDKDAEFQIKLFNPYTYTIGAEITINGQPLNETLVIKPGQIIWLERFFNEARKFKFDVYEVDSQSEVVKQAIKNNGDVIINFFKEKEPIKIKPLVWSTNISGDLRSANLATTDSFDITTSCTSYSCLSNTMETGRIEKGGYSNQNFVNVDVNFDFLPFTTERIKLLPKSQKPIYKEDLEKVYCVECGRKIKPKFKYCPFCGTKQ